MKKSIVEIDILFRPDKFFYIVLTFCGSFRSENGISFR